MLLANREFNHETENFHESLGISDEIRVRCRERIFFNTFSNALQRHELFEDDDDAPKELRTVSGDLQRCLRTISDQLEYEYTLMIFNTTQRIAMESFAYYKHTLESHDNKEDRIKLKIMELVEEMRGSSNDEEDEDEPISRLNKKTMVKRIKFVKQSHHNFDTYLNMLNRWANGNTQDFTEKKPDIDDLLRNLFSNDED